VPLGQTGKTWFPLDASFKQYTYKQGLDIPAILGFDANAFLLQAQAGATIDPVTGAATNINQTFIENEASRLRTLLQTYIETNLPNATMADIAGGRSIAQLNLRLLPASLPYRAVAVTSDAVILPDSLRHRITITVLDEFGLNPVASVTRGLPEVATQKITVSYGPASSADLTTLESLASQQVTSIPTYLVRLVSEIRVDEILVATGPSISMGRDQPILVSLEGPNQSSDQIRYDRVAGDYSLIGLDLGNSSGRRLSESRARLLQTKARLEGQELASLTKQELVGELLNVSMQAYWAALDFFARAAGGLRHAAVVRLPSQALNALVGEISYAFDAPITAKPGGFMLDVARSVLTPVSSSGDKEAERALSLSIGITSSYLEGAVFEQLFQRPGRGVSAAHILEAANKQGIPVYQVTQGNLATLLPLLAVSAQVRDDIQIAVLGGRVVYVPRAEVTVNGWTGTGYFIIDPASGAGAFLISGGLAGGSLIPEEDWLWGVLRYLGLTIGLGVIPFLGWGLFAGLLAVVALSAFVWYLSVLSDNFINNRELFRPTSRQWDAGIATIFGQTVVSLALALIASTILFGPIGLIIPPVAVVAAVFLILVAIFYNRLIQLTSGPRTYRRAHA